MTISAAGFRTYKQTGIDLRVGRLPIIDVQLAVGSLSETVTVSADAVILDTTQSKVAVTLPIYIMDGIPKGRSFESLIPFAPAPVWSPCRIAWTATPATRLTAPPTRKTYT